MYTNYMGYVIFLVIFPLLPLFWCYFHKKSRLPTNWPLLGMLPALLKHRDRLHDFITEVMEESPLTFLMEGPWFTNMKMLFTADPANAQHIFSKSFGNYPKGSKFKEIFEILGDGIFNADEEMWKYHRKMAQSVLAHPQFNRFLVENIWDKIETGLIPILDHVCKQGLEIELQDLFGRLAFDTISTVVMGYDPGTLCIDLPDVPFFSKGLHDGEEAIMYRQVVPACVWKFQRWLGIGMENKYREAWEIDDDFIYECISKKRKMNKNSQAKPRKLGNELGIDLMTVYMDEVTDSVEIGSTADKLLRDTILNFFAAGRDTVGAALSWFFYLLSKNPHVLSKIKEELDAVIAQVKYQDGDDTIIRDRYEILSRKFEELNDKLIYLHAAICETLRLYPPVPFNAKTPIESDTLPSGHKVDSSIQICFSIYAMGRSKFLWGEDCYEFKPERWILETGNIRYVPSYKFLAFNSGPRTCLGKNMSLTTIKAVAIAIISKYQIEPVQGHPVVPNVSIVLHMKHGLKAKVVTY